MASLRDIRDRIKSVKNTRQITRAMKLVAGAKLSRATHAATAAKPYQETLSRVLDRVLRAAGDVDHPLLKQSENTSDVLVVAFSASRGLAGNFNSLIIRATAERVGELQRNGKNVRIIAYGRKVSEALKRRGFNVVESHIGLEPARFSTLAAELADRMVRELGEDTVGEVYLSYNAYISTLTQEPRFIRVLPMDVKPAAGGDEPSHSEGQPAGSTAIAPLTDQGATEYLYEPSGPEILGQLLPMALRTRIFQAFLENEAGEHAKRMTAMDAATRNASDLINRLTLDYNRARQAAITKELIEIVSGAEAL